MAIVAFVVVVARLCIFREEPTHLEIAAVRSTVDGILPSAIITIVWSASVGLLRERSQQSPMCLSIPSTLPSIASTILSVSYCYGIVADNDNFTGLLLSTSLR